MDFEFVSVPRPTGELQKRVGYDVVLLIVTLALCTAGGIFVLTSSAAHAWASFKGNTYAIFQSHMIRLMIGLVLMVILSFIDYRVFARIARGVIVLALATLIAVLFMPQPHGATAHRWIYIYGFSFQPAELAKFALISYIAMRFAAHDDDPFSSDRRKIFTGIAILTVIMLSLIVFEPNLSMALMIFATVSLMMFIFGFPLKPLVLLGSALAIPMGLVAWFTPYMHERLISYVDSLLHPLKAGYNVKQSLVGIGHGGVFGIGLGSSTQKHFFLPEPYKDFIYSIVGEELGFWGATLLLLAFLLLLTRAWRISRNAPDQFGYYLGTGITFALALPFIINVGVTLGVLPATGQPLPFISYGGSALMMNLGAVGILLNISKQAHKSEVQYLNPSDFK